MAKKKNPIQVLYKSNRSKIVEAAIKSNFLELLKENPSQAFKSFLCNIYTRKFASKSEKQNYISNLKAMWNRNKEDLTKEINLHKKTQKNPESPQKNLSVEQSDVISPRKKNLTPFKQKRDIESITSNPGKRPAVVEDRNSAQNNSIKFKRCKLFEDQRNLNSIGEQDEFAKASRNFKTSSIKQVEMVNDFINFDNSYNSSESLASEFESETEMMKKNKKIFFSNNSSENSEFRTLRTIEKRKIWTVNKAEVKSIISFKTNILEYNWSNIVFDKYISTHNPYCVLLVKNSHVKKKNSNKKTSPFFRATASCKHSSCNTKHIFTIKEK